MDSQTSISGENANKIYSNTTTCNQNGADVLTPPLILQKEPTLKRTLDIVLSALMLILSLPVSLPIALAIKLEDGGPIFYPQERWHSFQGI